MTSAGDKPRPIIKFQFRFSIARHAVRAFSVLLPFRQVVDCGARDIFQRLARKKRLMSGDENIGKRQQKHQGVIAQNLVGMIFIKHAFFFLVDVQTQRAEMAGTQRRKDGFGIQ